MPTDGLVGVQTIAGPQNDDRHTCKINEQTATGLRQLRLVSDVLPIRPKDRLALPTRHVGIAVDLGGQGRRLCEIL